MLINFVHVLVESNVFLFIDYEDQLYVSGMPVSVVGSSNRFSRSLVLEEKNSIRDIKREYNDSADLAAAILRIFYLPIELSIRFYREKDFQCFKDTINTRLRIFRNFLMKEKYDLVRKKKDSFAVIVQASNFPVKITDYPGSYIDRASNS